MKRNYTKVLLSILILFSLVLTACGGMPFSQNPSKNQNREYYQGNDGVIMRFSDPTTPPTRMYYFEDYEADDNQFQVMVDVHNIGASWTKGALFVSGYDPYMIKFTEIDIDRTNGWKDCRFNLNSLLTTSFFSADCPGVKIGAGDNNIDVDVADIGRALGLEDSVFNGVGVDFHSNNGRIDLGASFDNLLDADVYNNGRGLLIAMSGLSFTRFNGLNYEGKVAGQGILAPDAHEFPGGEMTTVVFNGEIESWPKGLDKTDKPVTFMVTNCFLYSTYAAPQVCIDPAPYDQGVKVCQPRATTFNGGNGAPVAITSIEQENTRKKIFFEINIKNVGGGTIMDLGSMELCSPYYPGRLTSQDLNVVHLIDARIGGQDLDCSPDRWSAIRLDQNGRGTVRCSYNLEYLSAKSAYETPLIIELGYGYSKTIRRSTMIKRVL